jgi:hypothetical protein
MRTVRRASLISWVFSFCLLSTVIAKADTVPSTQPIKATALKLNGVDGVWLPLDSAKRLLAMAEDYPLVLQELGTLKELCAKKDEALKITQGMLSDSAKLAETLKVQVAEEHKGRVSAEEALGKWYRSPYLWFAAGVVVSSVTVISVASVVK